jgi:fructokinase
MPKILCFGEVLWDLLPSGKVLGGAPLNVTFRLNELKKDALLISAIGTDALGEEIKAAVKALNVQAQIFEHPTLATGAVEVALQADGSAKYRIKEPVAWDEIHYAGPSTAALVFGSLALRSTHNQQILDQLLAQAQPVFFDVNLRAPFYSIELIEKYIAQSDLIKFNDEEFIWYASQQNWSTDLATSLEKFQKKYPDKSICITLGENGAIWGLDGQVFRASAPKIKVKDTIGAGDAFFAQLIAGYLAQNDPQQVLEAACALGAKVASQAGATQAAD